MDALARVLQKERGFIFFYGIYDAIRLFIGSTSPINAFMSFLGCFAIVTIAHDEYNSFGEKITCVFLTLFPLLATCLVGVDISSVIARAGAAVLTGFLLRGVRFIMRKMES